MAPDRWHTGRQGLAERIGGKRAINSGPTKRIGGPLIDGEQRPPPAPLWFPA